LTFKSLWLQDQFQKLRSDPDLDDYTNEELRDYLLKVYDKRYISEGRLFNNVTNDNSIITQEQFINQYLNEPYILSGYGVFFKDQDNATNISSAALENLGKMRNEYKEKMKSAEHGSDEYTYYRILQLTVKVIMNSYYGILGQRNSAFYNPFVQNSITLTGVDLITTSIIAMEGLLSNNVKFEDTDDAITFIMNVRDEEKVFNILDYVDEAISKDELVDYLYNHSKDPEKMNKDIIRAYVSKLDIETVTRCYYKNQILEIITNNSWFKQRLKNMIQFTYAEKPAEEMKGDLADFKSRLLDFCYYDFLFEDRFKRAVKDKRQSVVTIDTDSNFINLDKYVKTTSELFCLDRENEEQQMTVMNIFIDFTTDALKMLFWLLTTNMGLLDRAKPIINMKSESTNRLHYRVIYNANSFNCWNRKKSAAKAFNN